ncbi:unnamed protein product [Ilex paraguariensis]|uniref:Uncharacterized protein n=1 Tax=Ilex paraguariensis TaxID=185542 RepID=A0ABC8RA35_9AQUA
MIECSVCHSKLLSPTTKTVSRAYDEHRSKISSKQRALNVLLVVGDCILVGLQDVVFSQCIFRLRSCPRTSDNLGAISCSYSYYLRHLNFCGRGLQIQPEILRRRPFLCSFIKRPHAHQAVHLVKNGMIECSVCHSKLLSPTTKTVSRAYDEHRSKISSKQRALNVLLVVGDCILVGLQVIVIFYSFVVV